MQGDSNLIARFENDILVREINTNDETTVPDERGGDKKSPVKLRKLRLHFCINMFEKLITLYISLLSIVNIYLDRKFHSFLPLG